VVYIYNPVATERLGVDKVAAGTNPLEAATPAAPAPQPPAAAPAPQPAVAAEVTTATDQPLAQPAATNQDAATP
jgi:hypothetical protein